MNRGMSTAAYALFAALSLPAGPAEAELVRHGVCTKGDATREIELRSIEGAADVCDIVERAAGESTEERTLYPAAARSAFCARRFESAVGSLDGDGWRCSVTPTAPSGKRGELQRVQPSAVSDVGPFASSWRDVCTAAHEKEGANAPESLCDCAVRTLSTAGFEERDFEVLVSPYDEARAEQPVHRAGLLYGAGMMAVDALARCEAP